jgi:hypothetical protein
MPKRKHRRGNKPRFSVTGRIANTQPEIIDLRHRPFETAVKLIGVDFGATEARVVAWVAGRRGGKTDYQRQLAYRHPGKSEVWRLAGPDAVLEPLGAGLSRILSRGAAQPVRYPWGG